MVRRGCQCPQRVYYGKCLGIPRLLELSVVPSDGFHTMGRLPRDMGWQFVNQQDVHSAVDVVSSGETLGAVETLCFDPTVKDIQELPQQVEPIKGCAGWPEIVDGNEAWQLTPKTQTGTQDPLVRCARGKIWFHVDHGKQEVNHFCNALCLQDFDSTCGEELRMGLKDRKTLKHTADVERLGRQWC
jgi:hypothetical protein